MTPRLLSADLAATDVEHDALPAAEVVEGDPTTGAVTLGSVRGVDVGIWEMSVGSARDTEVDEVFVVLAGRGSVTFEDGDRVSLTPGVAVRLRAGERTTWSVTETLRKVWVA